MKKHLPAKNNVKSVVFDILARPVDDRSEAIGKLMHSLTNAFMLISLENKEVEVKIGSSVFTSGHSTILENDKYNIQKTLMANNFKYKLSQLKEKKGKTESLIAQVVGVPGIKKYHQINKFIEAVLDIKGRTELLIIFRKSSKKEFYALKEQLNLNYNFIDYFNKNLGIYAEDYDTSKKYMERIKTGTEKGWGDLQVFIRYSNNESVEWDKIKAAVKAIFSGHEELTLHDIEADSIFDDPHISDSYGATKINVEELECFLRSPAIMEENILLPALSIPSKSESTVKNGVTIGQVYYKNTPLYDYQVPTNDFVKHASITSKTGGGKTQEEIYIAIQHIKNGGTMIAMSPTSDFNQFIKRFPDKKILLFKVGEMITPFGLDLVKSETRDSDRKYSRRLWDGLKNPLQIQNPTYSVLLTLLNAVITYCENNNREPTFKDLKLATFVFEKLLEPSKMGYYNKDKLAQSKSRLETIVPQGQDGTWDPIYDVKIGLNLGKLLMNRYSIILDCTGLDYGSYLILHAVISKKLRLFMEQESKNLPYGLHVLKILDEVSQLEYDTLAKKDSEVATSFREDRKYGIGNIASTQTFDDFSSAIICNSNLKIALGNTDASNNLYKLMNLDEEHKDLIQRLPQGIAVVSHGARKPFLLQIPEVERFHVTDKEITNYMKPFYDEHPELLDNKPEDFIHYEEMESLLRNDPEIENWLIRTDSKAKAKKFQAVSKEEVIKQNEKKRKEFSREKLKEMLKVTGLTASELRFIKNVVEKPFAQTTERIKDLGMDNSKFYSIKSSLERKHFIKDYRVRPLSNQKGYITITSIVPEAKEALQQHDIILKAPYSHGGTDHKFHIMDLAETYEKYAPYWERFIEFKLPDDTPQNPRRVDLVTKQKDRQGNLMRVRAHEIETNKNKPKDIIHNVRKCLASNLFDDVWVLTLTDQDEHDIYGILQKAGLVPHPKVRVMYIRKLFSEKRGEPQ